MQWWAMFCGLSAIGASQRVPLPANVVE
jgi:hypothetical protein